MAWHLAETREQARAEAVDGLQRWHNEYNVWTLGRPGAVEVADKWELMAQTTEAGASGAGAAVVGTPDDLVAAIRNMHEITGGFGVVLGFAHDWANWEATKRSWDLVARYVIPEINGTTRGLRESQRYLHENQAELMAGASAAVMQKIMAHEGATKAMATTMQQIAERNAAAAGSPSRDGAFRPGAGLPDASHDTVS
jgi:limonene 1,2-monooxygenase